MREYKVQREGNLVEYLLETDVELTFSALRKALKNKDVKVCGKRVNADVLVRQGDDVMVYLPESAFAPPYDVVFLDENVLIVDKHKGVTTETLAVALDKKYGARAVHRLDRNTAGLLVFARNLESEKELLSAFRHRTVKKVYLAEVYGEMEQKRGEYADYLVKNAQTSTVKVYADQKSGGDAIKTAWEVVEKGKYGTIVRILLHTGKTHQIRAHFAFHGHFVVGDGKYGKQPFNRSVGQKTQRLLAFELAFSFDGGVLSYLNEKTFKSKQKQMIFD